MSDFALWYILGSVVELEGLCLRTVGVFVLRECVFTRVANIFIHSLSEERTGSILYGEFEFPLQYILGQKPTCVRHYSSKNPKHKQRQGK